MDEPRKAKLTNAIAEWVAISCRPVLIVEDVGLKKIIRIASNDYTYALPSRQTIIRRIDNLYEEEKSTRAKELEQATSVCLTGDHWTSLGNHNYLGVTAHYIDGEWKLRSHALTVMKTEERHHADACADDFMHVAEQWNVENKVTALCTDSARNMIAAARQLPLDHVPCTAHSLQRSITVSLQNSVFDNALAKCRKVIGNFKHSPANQAELERQQKADGYKEGSLIQDVPTRWNSTLEMVQSVRRNEGPLRAVLATQTTKVAMPTAAEMDKYVTKLLGGEKYVSCSMVLPAICHILRVMESSNDDPAYMVKFKSTFTTDMEKRKEKANTSYLKIATALDPRVKDLKCLHRAERGEVWASLITLLKEEIQGSAPQQPVEEPPEPPKKRSSLLFVASDSESEEEDNPFEIEKCVSRYQAEPTISEEDCPLKWWSQHAGSHSRLACLAKKYLATPATSVPCERLFSLAGHIVAKKRVSLSSQHVIQLVCLSDWLGAKEEE
ncbi:Zinc finger BED domain-containing protein 1 [Merluccius polli]|uniref:Zinc finger BED domain-containing protein 1 n=1 Tax=Merluccius polli TaxID=89951 RepID=A0AA47MII8_MERPO|nr:Zinc finger BED domain-containing protein 1 [Merluccius polli]